MLRAFPRHKWRDPAGLTQSGILRVRNISVVVSSIRMNSMVYEHDAAPCSNVYLQLIDGSVQGPYCDRDSLLAAMSYYERARQYPIVVNRPHAHENPVARSTKRWMWIGGIAAAGAAAVGLFAYLAGRSTATSGGGTDPCAGLDAGLAPAQCADINAALASSDISVVVQTGLKYYKYPIARAKLEARAATLVPNIPKSPTFKVTLDQLQHMGRTVIAPSGTVLTVALTPNSSTAQWQVGSNDPNSVPIQTSGGTVDANGQVVATMNSNGSLFLKELDPKTGTVLLDVSMNLVVKPGVAPGFSSQTSPHLTA
jgi:hypothetical protein